MLIKCGMQNAEFRIQNAESLTLPSHSHSHLSLSPLTLPSHS